MVAVPLALTYRTIPAINVPYCLQYMTPRPHPPVAFISHPQAMRAPLHALLPNTSSPCLSYSSCGIFVVEYLRRHLFTFQTVTPSFIGLYRSMTWLLDAWGSARVLCTEIRTIHLNFHGHPTTRRTPSFSPIPRRSMHHFPLLSYRPVTDVHNAL